MLTRDQLALLEGEHLVLLQLLAGRLLRLVLLEGEQL